MFFLLEIKLFEGSNKLNLPRTTPNNHIGNHQ